MKIRIKSNYLTRYVLQDYGNMEPLLTFTPFVLVCILFILFPSHSHPLSALYFFPFALCRPFALSLFRVETSLICSDGKFVGLFSHVISHKFRLRLTRFPHFSFSCRFWLSFNIHHIFRKHPSLRMRTRHQAKVCEREKKRNIFVCTFIIEADDCYKNAVRRISFPFYSQWLCQVKEKMKVLYMHDIYGNVETISNKLFFINAIYKCVCSLLFPFFPLSR